MKTPGESESPFTGPENDRISITMPAPTQRQRVEFIGVELKLGRMWVRRSDVECLAGNETQANMAMARARTAYDRALEVFTGGCEIGKRQRRHLRGEIEKLAGLLQPRRAYQAGIYDQRICDPEHGI